MPEEWWESELSEWNVNKSTAKTQFNGILCKLCACTHTHTHTQPITTPSPDLMIQNIPVNPKWLHAENLLARMHEGISYVKGTLWTFLINKHCYVYIHCFSPKWSVCVLEAWQTCLMHFLPLEAGIKMHVNVFADPRRKRCYGQNLNNLSCASQRPNGRWVQNNMRKYVHISYKNKRNSRKNVFKWYFSYIRGMFQPLSIKNLHCLHIFPLISLPFVDALYVSTPTVNKWNSVKLSAGICIVLLHLIHTYITSKCYAFWQLCKIYICYVKERKRTNWGSFGLSDSLRWGTGPVWHLVCVKQLIYLLLTTSLCVHHVYLVYFVFLHSVGFA